MEIVGYVTVFIYKIRGTPRSVGINRKYQEKYPYLEFFTVKNFAENYFSDNIKLFPLAIQHYFSIVITFQKIVY